MFKMTVRAPALALSSHVFAVGTLIAERPSDTFVICTIRRDYRLSVGRETLARYASCPSDRASGSPKIIGRASSVTVEWQRERSLWRPSSEQTGHHFPRYGIRPSTRNEDGGSQTFVRLYCLPGRTPANAHRRTTICYRSICQKSSRAQR